MLPAPSFFSKTTSPTLIMQSPSDFQARAAFALLLIGTPKSGKTVFALNFPRPWILDADNNLAGALRYHRNKGEPITDYFFDDPNTLPEDDRWSFAVKATKAAVLSPDVDTIIIDGLSMLAWYLERHILKNSQQGNGMKDLVIAGQKVMNQSHWNPFKSMMMQLIMAARSAGKPFIMTCHETVETNDEGSVVAYRPLISGQLRANIAGLFTDCWRTETTNSAKGSEYSVRFAPRTMMQIGNSLQIPAASMSVTDKKRSVTWEQLNKYLSVA